MMGLPVLEQYETARIDPADSSGEIVLTAVTAGNLLVLQYLSDHTTNRTITEITDSQENTWTIHEQTVQDNRRVAVASAVAASTGNVTVTISLSGVARFSLVASEVSGQAETHYDDSSYYNDPSTSTTHYCAAVGEIDTSANVIIFAAATDYKLGTVTLPTDYTSLYVYNDQMWAGYLRSESALTDHRGEWSSSIARQAGAVIVSFVGEEEEGGIFTVIAMHYNRLMRA
jgi:hypothetical protein